METPVLKMENIHKWFGRVHALKGVDFQVNEGEVVGLVGDNGAGKSTLIKILVGIIPKSKGKIYWKGKEVNISSIDDSRKLGIEVVYQDEAVVDCLSVTKNVFLGRELVKSIGPVRILNQKKMRKIANELTKKLGLYIPSVAQEIRFCSGGERQGVAITRAMYFGAKLTVLDEPITALSLKGAKQVLDFVAHLRDQKIGTIFITHNIGHVYSVADRFVILSRGQKVLEVEKNAMPLSELEDVLIGI